MDAHKSSPCYWTTPAGGVLEYNPDTGEFIWVKVVSNRAKLGSTAGHVRPDGYLVLPCGTRANVAACKLLGLDVPDGYVVDHINRDTLDNRACNLRVVSKKVNAHNTGLRATNKTGARGVSWDSSRGKYRAALMVDGKQYSRRFDSLEAASEWYHSVAERHGVRQYQQPA